MSRGFCLLLNQIYLVPDREFLQILTFSERTKKTFIFGISELENDFGSY